MSIKLKMLMVLAVLLCLMAPSLSLNGEATTAIDYSYMADEDYTMDNQYVNITEFNTIPLETVNVSLVPGNLNRRLIHSGTVKYYPYGRAMRVNNLFYKYPINNADDLVMQYSTDLHHFYERDVYLNDTKFEIDGNACYGTTGFYFNHTYYLFYNNFTSGRLEILNGPSPHNFTNKSVMTGYAGRDIIPMAVFYLNNTFYMTAQNYSGIADDYIELYKSDRLEGNWMVCPGFKNIQPGQSGDWHTSGLFYLWNGTYYFLRQFWDNVASHANIIFYEINGSIENYSDYNIVHRDNNTRYYYVEYMPIGKTLIQWAYDYLSGDYYILTYQPNNVNVYYDTDVAYKIYPGYMIEYNQAGLNKSVKWSDYFSFNPFGVFTSYDVRGSRGNRTFFYYWGENTDLIYLQIGSLQYDKEFYSPLLTELKVFYPYDGVHHEQQLHFFINDIEYGFFNEHYVELTNTNRDYTLMTEVNVITPNGTSSFKRGYITLRNVGTIGDYSNSSFDIKIHHNPTETPPWWLIPGTDDWKETLGIIIVFVGLVIIMLGAIAKDKSSVTLGLLLAMSGLGLIGGSGLFSVLF